MLFYLVNLDKSKLKNVAWTGHKTNFKKINGEKGKKIDLLFLERIDFVTFLEIVAQQKNRKYITSNDWFQVWNKKKLKVGTFPTDKRVSNISQKNRRRESSLKLFEFLLGMHFGEF